MLKRIALAACSVLLAGNLLAAENPRVLLTTSLGEIDPRRPAVCSAFSADPVCCGENREDAIRLLGWLEQATA